MEPTVEEMKNKIKDLEDELAERKKEIDTLSERTSFFQCLFDKVQEDILVIDKDFVIRDANRVFFERYGLRKEDIIGKKCYEIIHHSKKPCQCPIQEARRKKRGIKLTQHEQKLEDGKRRLAVMYSVQEGRNDQESFVVISRDITEYCDLIKKLKTSERRFRAILDTATDAILSVDSEHKIILFNNAAQKIFCWPRKEILGKDLSLLIPEKYGIHHNYIKKILEEKDKNFMGHTISVTARRKSGEEFPADISLSYHEIDSEVTFTAIVRDMTKQREMEKKLLQSERLAAVGQAVASVAHEIRNPLMIIGGFSQQIRNSTKDQKTIQKLDMVIEEVRRLEKLVSDLRDFTREYNLLIRPASINEVIKDVLKIMEGIYPVDHCKFNFVVELDDDIGEVNCDPDKLKQVFINMIVNGLEAMEEGGTLYIKTKKGKDSVEIIIQDTGVGICEEHLMRIFEPFFTTRPNGSGLGLAISYRIIQAHNGEIKVSSTVGKGTTFTINLPA